MKMKMVWTKLVDVFLTSWLSHDRPCLPRAPRPYQIQDDTDAASESIHQTIMQKSAGRDAFVLLIDLILGNLASPDIDVDYFRTTKNFFSAN